MTLQDTRERALPKHEAQTLEDYLVYLKHVALYNYATRFCQGKIVLDLGCGEGYGSVALAGAAQLVVAVDYAFDAIAHARKKYARENIAFVVCDAQQLPLCDDAIDALISFEVIEHIEQVPAYLMEIKHVMRTSAIAVLSTPNRLLRLLPFQRPWNRFHRREYDHKGFARTLSRVFSSVEMFGAIAIPQILEIEKRRVKQNPLTVYPKMLAQTLIPRSIYNQLKKAKSAADTSRARVDFDALPFSANDFELSKDALRECITLVAVCER